MNGEIMEQVQELTLPAKGDRQTFLAVAFSLSLSQLSCCAMQVLPFSLTQIFCIKEIAYIWGLSEKVRYLSHDETYTFNVAISSFNQ
ncbi:MAG TPA: hypothetical protein VIQ31_29465 [Phormidium sp.]